MCAGFVAIAGVLSAMAEALLAVAGRSTAVAVKSSAMAGKVSYHGGWVAHRRGSSLAMEDNITALAVAASPVPSLVSDRYRLRSA